jgi:predicted SAM-dependent methyltransferase
VKLNLGCSDALVPGYVNVDLCPPADRIADLRQAWPWPDSSVDEIRAHDIFEHLPDQIHTFNECWRVLRSGGRVEVVVPTTDGRGAFQDPQHVVFFNRNTFFYYTDGDPHRERFGKAYGIRARFRVISEKTERLRDEVVKLSIVLEAVKR